MDKLVTIPEPTQVVELNTALRLKLQVGTGFKIRITMYMVADSTGEPTPLNDYNQPLCSSFHLKGV